MSVAHPMRTPGNCYQTCMRASLSALLLLMSVQLLGQSRQSASAVTWWRDYADHARQVPIGIGRSLNLLCEGRGAPTVILESGTGDGMAVWRWVQPVLAQHHRVCAYDRAGLGLSRPDLNDRDLNGIVSDLERLLASAHLRPPYLLVGHSFGGMVIRLYARRHPANVLGMVLVDPPSEGQMGRIAKIIPEANQMLTQEIDHSRTCAKAKELTGDCAPSIPDDAPADVAARLKSATRVHFLTQAAEMEADVDGRNDAEIEQAGTNLGDLPLTVLTSEQFRTNEHMPPELRAASQNLWMTFHSEIAAHSRRGSNLVVPGTGHYIQLERPDAVISAVEHLNVARHR